MVLKKKNSTIMTSDDTTEPPKNTVCRDFLRKICHRGNKCKFRHPEDSSILIKELDFCHDYQNKECTRPNCKFFHVTRKEQQYFEATGILPKHLVEAIARAKEENHFLANKNGETPECHKLGRGRYLHLDSKKIDKEIGIPIKKHTLADVYKNYDSYGTAPSYGDPEPKRRVVDEIYASARREALLGPAPRHSSAAFNEYCMSAEDEVTLLRRKVEELKKQVSDLQATNEFLLDQNAQLRLSKHTTTVSPLTAQALIPHTLTAPTVAALQPAAAATISQISQQLSSDLAAAQSTLRPGELATPTIVPVAPVSIASAVSLAPAALPAASLSQSLAQSIITMSGPSTSLVSYPIMTQSLRPVIPHSLGN